MTVDYIIDYINKIFTQTVNVYKKTSDSLNSSGDYITHYVEEITEQEILMGLDISLKNIALNTISLSLLETNGSSATVFKRISTEEFVRLPSTPITSSDLDIDESLAFAVMYKTLSFLYDGYSSYGSDADGIIASHNDVMRDYFMSRDTIVADEKVVYFRYSTDGTSWHDNFVDGDIYISFQQNGGVWSDAIKFVGSDGATGSGGSGASTFVELTDTPSTLTAGKWLKVNDAGDALEEADAPTATATLEGMQGAFDISGDIALDMRKGNGNTQSSYIVQNGDMTLDFTKTGDVYDLNEGVVYTMELFPEGFNCTLIFEARGNKIIDSTAYANLIQFMYDGLDIFILNNVVYPN